MFAQNSQRHMQAGEMLDAECRKLNTENRHGTSAHILWGMQSGFSGEGGGWVVGGNPVVPVSCWPSFSVSVRRRLVFCCCFKCSESVVLTLFTHSPAVFDPLCLLFSMLLLRTHGHLTTACWAIGFRKCRCPYSAFIRPRSMQLRPSAKRCARKYIFSN